MQGLLVAWDPLVTGLMFFMVTSSVPACTHSMICTLYWCQFIPQLVSLTSVHVFSVLREIQVPSARAPSYFILFCLSDFIMPLSLLTHFWSLGTLCTLTVFPEGSFYFLALTNTSLPWVHPQTLLEGRLFSHVCCNSVLGIKGSMTSINPPWACWITKLKKTKGKPFCTFQAHSIQLPSLSHKHSKHYSYTIRITLTFGATFFWLHHGEKCLWSWHSHSFC
jgi:hypothetical protein